MMIKGLIFCCEEKDSLFMHDVHDAEVFDLWYKTMPNQQERACKARK